MTGQRRAGGRHAGGRSARRRLSVVGVVGVVLVLVAAVLVVRSGLLAGSGPSHRRAAAVAQPGASTAPGRSRLSGAAGAPVGSGATGGTSGTSAGGPGVTLLFTGDMLVSDDLRAQAQRYAGGTGYDFRPMLARVAPLIRAADWSVCHQETPVSSDDSDLSGYPDFNAPFELVEAERNAGYDSCSTVSNHTMDQGLAGIRSTLDTFDRVGVRHVGSARNPAEARQLTIYQVGGIRIGHLAYAYGLNGRSAPNSWAVNLIDPARIRSDARRIRQAGAQFVVVSLHFGTEQQQQPTAYQRQVVDGVMASPDVALVVGHHAHVVQPIQRRSDGRWVIYGLGNLLAQQVVNAPNLTPPHRDGVIVTVRVAKNAAGRYAVTRVGYVPTFVNAPSDVVELAPPFSAARTVSIVTEFHAPVVNDTPR